MAVNVEGQEVEFGQVEDEQVAPETEPQAESEVAEEPEGEAAPEEKPQGAPEKKGPPKMLPYDRFREENKARKLAEARVAAQAEEIERLRGGKSEPKAPKQRTAEHDFIREAVSDDLDAIKADLAEQKREREASKDEQAQAAFYARYDSKVDTELLDDVEATWQAAREKAQHAGMKLQFTRRDILLVKLGERAEGATVEEESKASSRKDQLAKVNKIARAEGGPTVGKHGSKKSPEKMSSKELAAELGDTTF